ncbi:hypothetical protein LTR37_016206 [Vermiconidia calcicola]|uniref:Uncharacterized protein n=1 Tax=Vermiconidia calcicola TaxID=1690605 RepID=A0ACC3MNH5_9PEZI|nr:hypothetical protein LTR37_016206 [Vermiconidia calcicola]
MAEPLSILNPHPRKIPGPELLHHLVATNPEDDRVAVEYLASDGTVESLTYTELHSRADCLAHTIRSTCRRTSEPNDSRFIVPIFLPQCPDLYIAELAVLKAGAAFCPVTLDAPEERLRFILQDVKARILLTTSELAQKLPELEGTAIILVDDIGPTNHAGVDEFEVVPSQPAYVMYTSGSTGLPKGVVLSHSAATQALLAHDDHIPHFSRFLQFASPTFDVSVFEIFFPLFRRCTLVCGERRDLLTDLPGFIKKMRVDAAELTPSVASSLLNGRKSVPTLNLLLTIGEMLKRDVVEEFGGSEGNEAVLYGMYGPTEATIHCTLQLAFSKDMSVRNIGIPLDTVSAFILKPTSDEEPTHEEVEILPVVEEGELAVGGYQLADEYLSRPEQTAAAFVRHPVYGRLYRTGDRARLTTNGHLECLGRINGGQVKLRGQRVELGEVEYAALKTPGCQTVVADVIKGSLIVFCVCMTDSVRQSDVQESCRNWLPAFMVPPDVLMLKTLPYLASGKVDRKALSQMYCDSKYTDNVSPDVLTPRLRAILDIVSNVLRTSINGQTDLSAAGLDSISSIRLTSRLKQAGFPQPNAATVLRLRTIHDIDKELDRLDRAETDCSSYQDSVTSEIAKSRDAVVNHSSVSHLMSETDDVVPSTPVQSAMLSETLRDSRAYCNWIELEIDPIREVEEVYQWAIDLLRVDLSNLLRHGSIDSRPDFRSVSACYTKHAEDARSEEQMEFWQRYLSDFSPTTLPPMTGKRPSRKLERTSWLELDVNMPALRERLQSLGCTAPMGFQAALAYLVASYTGNSDVTYGVVLSGRHIPVPGIEHIFGPCLNTLPLRTDLTTTRTFSDLLHLVQDRIREAQNHSLTPLSDIKRAASFSEGPLFDILFVWQQTSLDTEEVNQAVREADSADHHEFNLVLEFEPSPSSIKARITYQKALISKQQVQMLIRQIDILVDLLTHKPNTLIEELANCLPSDALSVSNPSPSFASTGYGLLSQIELRTRETPSAPALVFTATINVAGARTDVLTYQELNSYANRLAHFLRALKTFPDELVCICMDKSVHLYIAILAGIKAGFGYLPLVPTTPLPRVQSILRQSRVKLCLCDTDAAPKFESFADVRAVDVTKLELHGFSDDNLAVQLFGSQVAYTVFTSGSTGEPKGVAVTMSNLLGNLQVLAEIYHPEPGDRLLQACSQAFDVSVFEIFFAFYTGMCLCSAPNDLLFRDLEGSIRTLDISHLSLTPTVAALIDPDKVPSVRFLVTAGEAVTDLVHRKWAGRGLHQGYGPSETTNICTLKTNVSPDDALGNIGRPLRNTSGFVVSLDGDFQLLPLGGVGEYAFGGEQVFRGYVARDSLNAEKILEHPQYGRLYRSGDIGRILPDGTLLISGRVDDQIKIRGNRVELGEINAIVLKNPSVRDCTTIVLGQDTAQQTLATFVVLQSYQVAEDGEQLATVNLHNVSELFTNLEKSLPHYMVPNTILPVSNLPRTPQGKLDRRALEHRLDELDKAAKSRFSRNHEALEDGEAWSAEETTIAAALADTLQIPSDLIARNSSFLALGLNSLTAIALARSIRVRLDTEVTVSMILNNPTCARLHRDIQDQAVTSTVNGHIDSSDLLPPHVIEDVRGRHPPEDGNIECILPATPLQQAMLSSGSGSSNSNPSYRNSTTLRVNGDVSKIMEAWATMMRRYSILRTQFVTTNEPAHPYVQMILSHLPLPWRQHEDRTPCGTDCNQSQVSALRPFCIDFYTAGSTVKLVLRMHHALYDGTSMSLLLREVESLHREEALRPPVPMAPFLAEAKAHNSESAIAFWSSKLQGYSPRLVPAPPSRKAIMESSIELQIPIPSRALDGYCQRYALSQLAVFQAAFFKVLACTQDTDDICFGNVVSGRSVAVPDIERLVAPCFNTIPIRVKTTGFTSNLELARRMHQYNVDALGYQLTPLRRVQALSKSPSKHLFDALLLLQPPQSPLDSTVWVLEEDEGPMDMPLVIEIIPKDDSYKLLLHYQDPQVEQATAASLTRAFTSAVESCLKFPSSNVKDFYEYDTNEIAACLASDTTCNGETHEPSISPEDGEVSEEEDMIRRVFAELAGLNETSISRSTSMYQIGLDSLNAAQVAARLRSLGVAVDAADVMETLTPIALAGLAGGRRGTMTLPKQPGVDFQAFDQERRQQIASVLDVDEQVFENVRPCTSSQSGMLAQSLTSGGRLYINHVAYLMPEGVSRADIERAWRAVIARHQVLHMGFHQLQGSKYPFAMGIFKPSVATTPIVDAEVDASLASIECRAAKAIMEAMASQPWRITMQRSEHGITMVLSLHHALYDANSLRIILSDLVQALASSRLKRPTDIDAILQSTLSAEADEEGSTSKYWSELLRESTISKFPDLAATTSETRWLQCASHTCELSLTTVEQFCRREAATIQALGQTVWALLLAAYTGEGKVMFGTVLSGTHIPDAQGTPFPSITTIPVPCDTGRSNADILRHMTKFNGIAHRHRHAPLADIQRLAGNPRGHLFDTVFVYQKTESADNELDWTVVRETAAVDYAASLELEVDSDYNIVLRLTTDGSRIPQEHASLMLKQYDHLLMEMVSSRSQRPESPLHSILPARHEALPSASDFLHGLFEDTARNYPDRTALEFVDNFSNGTPSIRTWTYMELNERGNQIANLLRRSDVPPNSIVAISMNKSPEASFGFLGILKAGCAFLAIDPELPESRVQYILQDSGARMMFVDHSAPSNAGTEVVPCIRLSEACLMDQPSSPVDSEELTTNSDCYCLYTSGTTGTPKGCEITHENAVQAIMAFQRLFSGRWTKTSRWLQFASYWFDVAVLEQFWSWSVGITVVSAPRDLILEDIPHMIRKLRITHIDLTPSLARLVQPEDVPSLWGGVFITGGEALKQGIIDAWGPKKTVCNGYGPTEATIGVTMNRYIGTDAKPSNIGRQFDNVGTCVLHPDEKEAVLRGAVGELCISGKLVGKGYLNRPELTKQSFPFVDWLDARVYRTGDLVRMLFDDSFMFVGRKDSQAKLRGQRLEVSEIDNVIRKSDATIAYVASLVIKADEAARETLVSFITIKDQAQKRELRIDRSGSIQRLLKTAREACIASLPGYMVPTYILPINFLPLTVNNKADNKRLAELFRSCSLEHLNGLQDDEEDAGTLNPTERTICEALAELLPVQQQEITRRSNLFSLGLSSISAISFSSVLKRNGFQKASVTTIMSNPTLRQLSTALTGEQQGYRDDQTSIEQAKLSITAFAQRYGSVAAQTLGLTIDEIETVAPCSPLQQGLILDSLRDDNQPYFNDFCYSLHRADFERLQIALQKLVDTVQILRTRFIATDDGFAQAVVRSTQPPLSTWAIRQQDFDTLRSEKKEQWLLVNERSLHRPFEVHIVRTNTRAYMIVHVHHALYDGISYDGLFNHLFRIYVSGSVGDLGQSFISALPYGPLRPIKDGKTFWTARLESDRRGSLPKTEDAIGDNDPMLTLELSQSTKLEAVRRRLGVSHQAVAQACFEIALRQTIPSVGAYGIVVSGRSIELEGADHILGPMFNTIPQPLIVNSESFLPEYIRRCHNMNVESLPYQHTPLRDIRKWCPTAATFDVLFVFQHKVTLEQPENNEVFQLIAGRPRADYPLACEVEITDEGRMSVTLFAQSQYMSSKHLHCLLASFQIALDHISDEATLGELFGVESTPDWPKPQANGNTTPYVNGVEYFEWTQQATNIRQTIADVAGLDPSAIDAHTTIFALGLDSIDAVKLASRLKKAGMSIPVSKILQAQRIPKMLRAIETSQRTKEHSEGSSSLDVLMKGLEAAIRPRLSHSENIEKILPSTPHQEGLVADMLRSDLHEYFNHDILRLRPGLDLDQLQNAWQMVIDGTSVLRTSFTEVTNPEIDAVYAQVVHRSHKLRINHIEAEHIHEHAETFEGVRQDSLANIESEPPLRLTIVTTPSDRYLILSLAHALYDGYSLALLHEDVQRAYRNAFLVRPPYEEVIEEALNATSEDARRFWAGALSGASVHSLPRRSSAGAGSETHRAEIKSNLSVKTVREFCQSNGVSMQALAQTCWALTLAAHTHSLEVLFGVVLACRDTDQAQEIMFPTMNTIVVRSSLHGSRAQMLQYMQSMISDARPYHRTPLRTIQAAAAGKVIRSKDSPIGNDLFDSLFIYQNRPTSEEHPAAPLYDSVGGQSNVEYPVAVEMEAVADVLVIRTACKDNVLDERGTAELLNDADRVLQAIVASPDEPTVNFEGSAVSICGLRPFRLENSTSRESASVGEGTEGEETADAVSPLTQTIVEALAQVAKVPLADISSASSIESIGIDSISAIKLAAVLRKKSIRLSVSEILRAKTAARMASTAESKTAGHECGLPQTSSVEIVRQACQRFMLKDMAAKAGLELGNVEVILPATAGQVYMLRMWQKTAGQLFYPTFSYQVIDFHDQKRIEDGWSKLVARHAILRTAFCATGDSEMPMLQVVLRDTPRGVRHEGGSEGTDLGGRQQQPMVSLRARKADEGYLLDLKIHHALYDAVSLPLVIEDFRLLLSEQRLPDRKLEYAYFLALAATQQALNERKVFWKHYLQNVRPMRLRQPQTDGAQMRVEIFKPGIFSMAAELEAVARREGLSLQAILFAAYAKVYTSLAAVAIDASDNEASDVVLGIYLSNRSHLTDLESLPAPTVNLVPLLVRSPKEKSVLELAKQVQRDLQAIGDTAARCSVALWEVVEWTGVQVDTFVNFLKLPDSPNEQEDGGNRSEQDGGVLIHPVDGLRLQERQRVAEAPQNSTEKMLPELEDLRGSVVDAYQVSHVPVHRLDFSRAVTDKRQHSLDIEMTVTNDGKLDVGLFCPEELLGLQRAGEALQEMVAMLEKVVGKARE